jgi:SAM-dependent methyltransferase
MKTTIRFEPLVEFGFAVAMEFRNRRVQAYSDVSSGYVFFDPPPAEELNDYCQREYPRSQVGYYTIETDYDAGKNSYQAGRILEAYNSVMQRPPQTSFELGCAYGGLVAEMAGRGIASRGSDINEEAIRQGIELKGNRSIFHANNLDALARMESKVDLIYSLGSLEHDPNMFRVIEVCRERLTENGLLFIMIPNAMFASSVLNGFKHNWWVNYSSAPSYALSGVHSVTLPKTLVLYRMRPKHSQCTGRFGAAGRVRYSGLKEAAPGEAIMPIQSCWG